MLNSEDYEVYAGQKGKRTSTGTAWITVTVIVITMMLVTLVIVGMKDMKKMNNTNEVQYESIDKLMNNSPIDLDLPEIIKSIPTDELRASIIMNEIVEIGGDNVVLRASRYMADNVDPLGMYEISEIYNEYKIDTEDNNEEDLIISNEQVDNIEQQDSTHDEYEQQITKSGKLESNNKGIIYFRYRQGYPNYEHCTIINWHENNIMYGMIYGDLISEQEALKLIGLTGNEIIN